MLSLAYVNLRPYSSYPYLEVEVGGHDILGGLSLLSPFRKISVLQRKT